MNIKIIFITISMITINLAATIPLPPPPSVSHASGGNTCEDAEVLQLVTNIKHLPILSAFISDRSAAINDAGWRISSYQTSIRSAQLQINDQVSHINDLTLNKIPAITKEIGDLNTQMQKQATLSADALCNAQAVSYMVGPLSTALANGRTSTGVEIDAANNKPFAPNRQIAGMTPDQYDSLKCAADTIANCIKKKTSQPASCQKLGEPNLGAVIIKGYVQQQDALKNPINIKWYDINQIVTTFKMVNKTMTDAEKAIRAVQDSVASIKKTIMIRVDQRKAFADEIAKSKVLIAQLQESINQYKTQIAAQQEVIAINRQAVDSAKAAIEDLQKKINVPDAVYSRCPQYLQSILA